MPAAAKAIHETIQPIAGGGDHKIAANEILRVKIGSDRSIERRYRLCGTLDRPAQRMIRKVRCMKQLRQQLVRCVFDHLHFFDDHLLLFNQIVFIKARIRQEVGKQIERPRVALVGRDEPQTLVRRA